MKRAVRRKRQALRPAERARKRMPALAVDAVDAGRAVSVGAVTNSSCSRCSLPGGTRQRWRESSQTRRAYHARNTVPDRSPTARSLVVRERNPARDAQIASPPPVREPSFLIRYFAPSKRLDT